MESSSKMRSVRQCNRIKVTREPGRAGKKRTKEGSWVEREIFKIYCGSVMRKRTFPLRSGGEMQKREREERTGKSRVLGKSHRKRGKKVVYAPTAL